jgi:AraC-like DNA-binding protein
VLSAAYQLWHTGAGLGAALRHAQIRCALDLMHANVAHDWTLDELAQRVSLSRTAFAMKFRAALGDTPLSYLRTLRMQHAMRLLSESGQSLESIAASVGYQDAFGFSKVFKKVVGTSPRAFRQQDLASTSSPHRFRETPAAFSGPGKQG